MTKRDCHRQALLYRAGSLPVMGEKARNGGRAGEEQGQGQGRRGQGETGGGEGRFHAVDSFNE